MRYVMKIRGRRVCKTKDSRAAAWIELALEMGKLAADAKQGGRR
jgi:hypothetical protein